MQWYEGHMAYINAAMYELSNELSESGYDAELETEVKTKYGRMLTAYVARLMVDSRDEITDDNYTVLIDKEQATMLTHYAHGRIEAICAEWMIKDY